MSASIPSASTAPASAIRRRNLEHFLWLSIATAIATVLIKGYAAWLTNSVGLWSDALESTVNLAAALVALWALRLSAKPADHNHDFGHGKAEYVSAAVEGTLIFVAAAFIIYGAVLRLFNPVPLEQLGLGLMLSMVATLLNLGTGLLLIRAGKQYRSITLEADGKHLLTDVWTSVGVLVAIGLVALTGWHILDPLIAIAVGVNILLTGYGLVRRSVVGLLDAALPEDEVAMVSAVINEVCDDPRTEITELRTRESGRQRFVYVTLTVPGTWTVKRSHDVADAVEDAVSAALADTTTFVHIEPTAE
ncbi:MAG TPA: cation diffusion facilitator family transporter [Propionicimonas sp.]|nr:cation diffusion facilitator family transporter [Propionicimonas sp.]HQA78373.1 cation diffusion facilitator family transporter [Propionicimonas sp.]HQD97475.1 cation diffusion facilitator family transporter [Propionicimonas sp.]